MNSSTASRNAQGPAPVRRRAQGASNATTMAAMAQALACTRRSCARTCQAWPVRSRTHSDSAVMATRHQGSHSASWRAASASGSASAAHSANSWEGSAPVW